MFLHGGWAHILGTMVFLWVFGGHIERSMGHLRYLVFYLLCGLGASVLEIATAANSNVPGLGASGAIAGVLAAYLPFRGQRAPAFRPEGEWPSPLPLLKHPCSPAGG